MSDIKNTIVKTVKRFYIEDKMFAFAIVMSCGIYWVKLGYSWGKNIVLEIGYTHRVVKLIFTGGHISLVVAFKGSNVILGLYKCNYSLTGGKELGTASG